MITINNNTYKWIEFVFLFFGIPILLLYSINILHPSAILLPIVLILIIYFRKQRISWQELKRITISKRFLITNILLIGLSSVLLFLWVYTSSKPDLFDLPRQNFNIWLVLFILYPVFSASLQEITFRVFLFRRYKQLFVKPWMAIAASAIAFSFAHIFYLSYVSLLLTLILGLYLAYLYYKTSSFLLVAIIHSFYGNLIFTIGLGQYFWLDMHKYL